MIDGFETRESTDIPVRALVKSAKGTLYKRPGDSVDQYITTMWDYDRSFKNPIAVFGMLRGTGQLIEECSRDGQDFYFFDHAYLFGNKHNVSREVGEKVYRLTKNYFHIRDIKKLNKPDYERIEKYRPFVHMKPWKYEGDYILFIPPSDHVRAYYYFNRDWEKNTLKEIKKHTRKEIKIRTKDSKVSLEKDLENAYCTVSYQSTVVIESIMSGVPSFCANESMGLPVSLTDLSQIKDPLYCGDRQEWIDSLLANQFTMSEIENGTAWKYVSNT